MDAEHAGKWPRGMREATAAEYLGLSVSSLRTVVKAGGFKAVQLTPGRVVYLREDLDSYLDRAAGRVPVSLPPAFDFDSGFR
jgi:predicted site-specific integrase-resolvase